MPRCLHVPKAVYSAAAVWPPASRPIRAQFLLHSATARSVRTLRLLSTARYPLAPGSAATPPSGSARSRWPDPAALSAAPGVVARPATSSSRPGSARLAAATRRAVALSSGGVVRSPPDRPKGVGTGNRRNNHGVTTRRSGWPLARAERERSSPAAPLTCVRCRRIHRAARATAGSRYSRTGSSATARIFGMTPFLG
jgi:hypothetical protein